MSSDDEQTAPTGSIALFAGAVLSSAFLIFAVQPMVGKHILPWFGGTPAVWMCCLAFYQTALFFGYAYAYVLIGWVSPTRQPWIHAIFFVAAIVMLPVLPGESWKPEGGVTGSLVILVMLFANVAIPFMLLASTGPLVQAWFARSLPGRSPYPLYAVSNFGSLLALLSYPFLVEPHLTLSSQASLWSWGFVACGVAILVCAFVASRNQGAVLVTQQANEGESNPIDAGRVALWIVLPACAVILFMGVTNQLCLDTVSMPFLWIVPLSIYLVTLILCFGSDAFYRREVFVPLAAISLGLLLAATVWNVGGPSWQIPLRGIGWQVGIYSAALYLGCTVLHGELHRLRPPAASLTSFYLCVAGGGALGGLFVGIAAPSLFDDYFEVPIAVVAACALTFVAIYRDRSQSLRGARRFAWGALALAGLIVLGLYVDRARISGLYVVEQQRNFFGILRITSRQHPEPHIALANGTTRHGLQYRDAPQDPSSYYGAMSGVGMVTRRRAEQGPMKLGVVGLGVGTMAAYARSDDTIVFYEIDPDVVRIAQDTAHFSYLATTPARVEIVVGDARLSLESELASELEGAGARDFDILIIDAFSSDAIPIHLLTREAFELYDAHLAENGVLAVHISNRHLNLAPPVQRLARHLGMKAVDVRTQIALEFHTSRSIWMILSRDRSLKTDLNGAATPYRRKLGAEIVTVGRSTNPLRSASKEPLWTDDYSNVFDLF